MFQNNKTSGFTLIEVLLAVVIGTIIMTTVYNVFWTGTKIDGQLRFVHGRYLEALKTDFILTRDLENAIALDLSSSYPDLKAFAGTSHELEFYVRTGSAIKRVRYFSGTPNSGTLVKTIIGRHMTKNTTVTDSKVEAATEFLMRQELDLKEWVNQGMAEAPVEILASSQVKGSFQCQYAKKAEDLSPDHRTRLSYQEQWSQEGLPMSVRCRYKAYDPKHPDRDTAFEREMFLSPQGGK